MPRTTAARVAPRATSGGLSPHCASSEACKTRGHSEQVTLLPPATRSSQLRRWGIAPDRIGALSARDRRGASAEEPEPLEGDLPEPDFGTLVQEGGWHVVEPSKGSGRGGGTTSHRGVLHPDEYVDQADLEARISERLGFTVAQVRSVYRQGRMSAEGQALRAQIDARLLEVAEDGGLMLELARVFGWAVKPGSTVGGPSCNTVERALSRARVALGVA